MKRTAILFLIFVVSFASSVQSQTPIESKDSKLSKTEPIKVMSFNIRYGTARDGDNRWDKRRELVVQAIENFDPDLLGTQETLQFQADYLLKNLSGFEYVGTSRDKDPKSGEQCGILFRKERFEKVEAGQFWLSENPDQRASKSWDSSLPRIATWVVLKDKVNKKKSLVFINTHFDHIGHQARLESAKLIRNWIEKKHADDAVIVTGDFNCGESSRPYNALVNKMNDIEIIDSYRASHSDAGHSDTGHSDTGQTRTGQKESNKQEGTFSGYRGNKAGARIDWILHSEQFETTKATIDRFNVKGRYPSDHYPVTAVLKFQSSK